jgi:Phasin protein
MFSHRAVGGATEVRSIGLMSTNATHSTWLIRALSYWKKGVCPMKNHTADKRARDIDRPSGLTQWWSPPIMSVAFKAGETCAAWNGEVLRFASDRLRQDSEFGFALAKCRSWTEAAELQRDWATKTTQDYVEEGGRLLRLSTHLGADIAETSSERA